MFIKRSKYSAVASRWKGTASARSPDIFYGGGLVHSHVLPVRAGRDKGPKGIVKFLWRKKKTRKGSHACTWGVSVSFEIT